MNNFRDLLVWRKSISLVKEIYRLTSSFPKEEVYGLASQIRRAVVSIPSNIAEGSGRSSNADFYRFLSIAVGSSFELETQLVISNELTFLKTEDVDHTITEIQEIQRMLRGLQKSLKL